MTKQKSDREKIFIRVVSLITFVIITLISGFAVHLYYYSKSPASNSEDGIIITVSPGQGFNSTVSKLSGAGVITSPDRFRIIGFLTGDDKKIKAGEYRFSASMTPEEILEVMVKGKVFLHRLTVPEGFNIYQIAALVQERGLGKKDAFIHRATDPDFAQKMGIKGSTFEGYLFPDTYYFPRGISHDKVIKTMINRFYSVLPDKWKERSRELGFTIHEIITLASIIEKETGVAKERPLISSVFHNRLRKKMRLETDPTVIYGIRNFDGNITRAHLRTKTPYNTYKIKGLPPGPIANPGIESIKAALYPLKSDYLYFVAKKDKTHHFSTNIREHNYNVRKYQLRR